MNIQKKGRLKRVRLKNFGLKKWVSLGAASLMMGPVFNSIIFAGDDDDVIKKCLTVDAYGCNCHRSKSPRVCVYNKDGFVIIDDTDRLIIGKKKPKSIDGDHEHCPVNCIFDTEKEYTIDKSVGRVVMRLCCRGIMPYEICFVGNITSIEDNAFGVKNNVTYNGSVRVPASVKRIGKRAFKGFDGYVFFEGSEPIVFGREAFDSLKDDMEVIKIPAGSKYNEIEIEKQLVNNKFMSVFGNATIEFKEAKEQLDE